MSVPPVSPGHRPRSRAATAAAVVLLVASGLLVRLRGLDEGPLFIDEAESSINALSILAEGAPRDHFLGLPLYENTLVEPWRESAEYEFRDLSYSPRGYASYHGWLPLYAIAASLAAHGIRPDALVPDTGHLEEEVARRIRAARLPSVLFAAVFLVGLFLAGRALFGVDAGLAALAAGAFLPQAVWVAQLARYHSAALAIGVFVAWSAWRAARRGRRSDFVVTGILAALLFHASSLAVGMLVLACLPLAPAALRRPGAGANAALLVLAFGVLVLPWVLWTGFAGALGRLPMARDLLSFPSDYLAYAAARKARVAGGAGVIVVLLLTWLARRRLPARIATPVGGAVPPVLFCAGWAVAAYAGFHLLTPASSLWMERLDYALLSPTILLGALLVALGARTIAPRAPAALALGVTLLFSFASGNVLHRRSRDGAEAAAVVEAARTLLAEEPAPDRRVYALPSQHLCLTYFTGLPVQSVLPVRRSFLDAYPGPILILETAHRPPKPPRAWLAEVLAERGVTLAPEAEQRWNELLNAHLAREAVAPRVRRVAPIEPLPPHLEPALPALARRLEETAYGEFAFHQANPAMFGGLPALTMADFWQVYFYRFVQPETRMDEHLNYAARARSAEAQVLRSGWVVLRCPPLDRTAEAVLR